MDVDRHPQIPSLVETQADALLRSRHVVGQEASKLSARLLGDLNH
jgi:hypothetical protein